MYLYCITYTCPVMKDISIFLFHRALVRGSYKRHSLLYFPCSRKQTWDSHGEHITPVGCLTRHGGQGQVGAGGGAHARHWGGGTLR